MENDHQDGQLSTEIPQESTLSGPDAVVRRPWPLLGSVRAYMEPLRPWPRYRAMVTRAYREVGGRTDRQFNARRRALLARCVFEVADEVESRHAASGQQPDVTAALFDVLNRLYDDLGYNEYFAREIKNAEAQIACTGAISGAELRKEGGRGAPTCPAAESEAEGGQDAE